MTVRELLKIEGKQTVKNHLEDNRIHQIPPERKDLKVRKCVRPVRLAVPLLLSHQDSQNCRKILVEYSTVEQVDPFVGTR